MTHKTWPPPEGTLLILTDARSMAVHRVWADGDVLLVVAPVRPHAVEGSVRVVRLRDPGGQNFGVVRDWCRPLTEEDQDDQT